MAGVALGAAGCGDDADDPGVRGDTVSTDVETTGGTDPSDDSGSGDGTETEEGGEGTDDPAETDTDSDADTGSDTDNG